MKYTDHECRISNWTPKGKHLRQWSIYISVCFENRDSRLCPFLLRYCLLSCLYHIAFYHAAFYNAAFYNAAFYNAAFYNAAFYNAIFYGPEIHSADICNTGFYDTGL